MHIRRLLLDVARRYWSVYTVFAAFALALLLVASGPGISTADIFAGSMLAAYALGVAAFTALAPREIHQLPIARRDLWRVGWLLAVIVPAALTSAVKLVVTTVSTGVALTGGQVLLSGSYDLLYCGANGLLVMLMPFNVAGPRKWWHHVLPVAVIVTMLGGLGWPFLISRLVPLQPTLVNILVSLTLATVVAVIGYSYRPRPTARASRPVVAPRRERSGRYQRSAAQASRLTGFSALVWMEGRFCLSVYAVLLLMMAGYWRIVEGDRTLLDIANAGKLLPFSGVASETHGLPLMVMMLVMGSPDLRFMGDMRRMRALPLSAARLAATMSGFAILSTVLIWIVLLALHLIIIGTVPGTLRPDLFMVVAGTVALSRAIRLTLPGHMLTKTIVSTLALFPALAVFSVGYVPLETAMRAAMIGGGATVLLASVVLTRWGLRRSSRLYQRQPVWPPFANTQNPN